MGWLNEFQYRKSHIIQAASGAGTFYQKQITVHYGAGADGDDDVYLNSHSRIDFGDVRFTDNDGNTLLDYWMFSKTDSDNAVFWVEVADSLENPVTIYVYYGKTDATTTSNINNTFIDANDFENDVVDQVPSPWIEEQPTLFIIRVKDSSSYIKHGIKGTSIKAIAGGSGFLVYRQITTINENNNRAIEFWFKDFISATSSHQIRIRDGANDKLLFQIFYEAPNLKFQYHNGSAWVTIMNININTWYHIKIYNIDFTNRQFDLDVDEINKVTNGTMYALATQLTHFLFRSAGSSNNKEYAFDTFFIRKYVSPEPAHSTWGSEEEYEEPLIGGVRGKGKSVKPTLKIDYFSNYLDYGTIKAAIRQTLEETQPIRASLKKIFEETINVKAKIAETFEETMPITASVLQKYKAVTQIRGNIVKSFQETVSTTADIMMAIITDGLKVSGTVTPLLEKLKELKRKLRKTIT